MMAVNRERIALACERIERAGGSVREYLALCGCVSPWGTWFRLQIEELGRKRWQITDGKGGTEVRKITLEQKKKAVEIAVAGGNPLPYLKECGSKKPEGLWYTIKQSLKEANPELYAKLPERLGAKPVQDAVTDARMAELISIAEQIEVAESRPTKPVNYAGFDVLSVRNPDTMQTFSYDPKHEMLEWRTEAGDEVSMKPAEWRELIVNLHKVMEIFGI